MKYKLTLSDMVKNVLDDAFADPNVANSWAKLGYTSVAILLDHVVSKINANNPKWELNLWDVSTGLDNIYGGKCNYYAEIETDDGKNERRAYVFFTLPKVDSRSAFFEQQFFPVISSVMEHCSQSNECHLTNMPVYIVNVSTDNMTASMATSCFAGCVVGFNYIDMMNNDIGKILLNEENFDISNYDITDYDQLLKKVSNKNVNSFFDLDLSKKVIKFNNIRFTDKSGVLKTKFTNEPYWFMLKALAAVYIVDKKGFTYDLTETNKLTANKSMDAFKEYINKVGE